MNLLNKFSTLLMGKYSELNRKLMDLVRSGEVDGQKPKEVLEAYPDYAKMNAKIFFINSVRSDKCLEKSLRKVKQT